MEQVKVVQKGNIASKVEKKVQKNCGCIYLQLKLAIKYIQYFEL